MKAILEISTVNRSKYAEIIKKAFPLGNNIIVEKHGKKVGHLTITSKNDIFNEVEEIVTEYDDYILSYSFEYD